MAESFSKQDVRSLMKFQFLQGKKPPDMFRELQQVLGKCAPTEQTVRKWYRLFAEGRESVEDNDRSGRPMTATNETVVKKVQELLDDDRRRTCEELAEDVGVSVGSVHTILTERLHLQKKFCKWVPHLLTGEQKMQRTVASSSHLRRFHREGEDFLSRIVAGDETWVYSWDPETKAQSAEWLPAHSPRPQKAIRKQGAMKIMHVMFFDSQGILLNWAVPQGTTVNGDYYKWILQEKLRPAIRKKRPDLLESAVILLHDNAPAHRKHNVVELLSKWGWEVLQHPAYSPDLSPCDFFLFPSVKKHLRAFDSTASSTLRLHAIKLFAKRTRVV
ncbi:hypothetical protein BOX15_Mlig004941g5 [Macrostomum lignano]|uniref:Mos1 transposase HTH domain-containing protein n=1 Tax=Macrostomum lignano TaxID=282301 RepID=A0A267E0K0_9PLAT|nr:hypothetical protein BOX15_Mlig004941g5 [Macrostomum lignano]